jgi:transcription elongation factor GreA
MLDEIREKLSAEVAALNHELHVVLPETLKKARELGDLRENGDFQAAIERQGFVQARLNILRSRLSKLSQIDLSKIPADRIGLGSKVTVQDVDTKEKENWELVIPDAMDVDAEQISVSSPLGQALIDRKKGQTTTVQLPTGKRKLKILSVRTFHDQLDESEK